MKDWIVVAYSNGTFIGLALSESAKVFCGDINGSPNHRLTCRLTESDVSELISLFNVDLATLSFPDPDICSDCPIN